MKIPVKNFLLFILSPQFDTKGRIMVNGYNNSNNHSKSTKIYIDSDLGNNIKGEVCAKQLFDKGFHEIYLATGYSKEGFDEMPWIMAFVGKEPPFY
jgi:capsular polysaccharide biosynthesis protein